MVIFIFIFLSLAGFLYLFFTKETFKKTIFSFICLSLFSAWLGSLIGYIFITFFVLIFGDSSYVLDERRHLISLTNHFNAEVSGDFFLATGSFDTDNVSYYIYYYRNDNGAIKQDMISSGNAFLYEVDNKDESFYVDIYTRKVTINKDHFLEK